MKLEVFEFFKNQKWPAKEAKKFFNHYSSIGWMTNGKLEIIDWHATAENWMLRDEEIKNRKTANELSQKRDNLKTIKNKDYGQPL